MNALRVFMLIPAGLAAAGLACFGATRYGDLPLSFEQNRGQAPRSVQFLAHGSGYALFLGSGEATLNLDGAGLRMRLEGARRAPACTPLDDLGATANYLVGNDPSQWRTGIRTYSRVKYENVYRGIDVIYYGRQRQLEYDFVVRPGARPDAIRLRFDGAEKIEIDSNDDLVVRVAGLPNPVRFHKPSIYQDNHPIAGGYSVDGRQVRFHVGPYDRARPLVIDPVLSYSTYLGGSGFDQANAIAVDATGAAYVAGYTRSVDFPVVPVPPGPPAGSFGPNDKLTLTFAGASNSADILLFFNNDPLTVTGSPVFSASLYDGQKLLGTYSSAPSVFNNVKTLICAFVAPGKGSGVSSNMPTSVDFSSINNGTIDGRLVLTVSGGSVTGLRSADFIFYDASSVPNGFRPLNDMTIKSLTSTSPASPASPLGNGSATSNRVFVAKLNPAGNALVYSTYLGGMGTERALGIAVDKAGNAYVTGTTTSKDFPTVKPFQATYAGAASFNTSTGDVFVAELNPAGTALIFSTFLGGSGSDQANAIALDAAGNIYLTGYTTSANFPLASPIQPAKRNGTVDTGFIAKFAPGGASLVFSTFLGGANFSTHGNGIAVDPAGNVLVTGYTFDSSFPVVNASQPVIGGGRVNGNLSSDAFVTKLTSDGSHVVYSTFLGGSYLDYGNAIAVDTAGNAYVAGQTYSTDFPVLGAQQAALNGTSLYQSADGSANFAAVAHGMTGANVTSILVDPTNSLNVYSATSDTGIFNSTDGGATWSPSQSGIDTTHVQVLAAAGSPPVLYAGLGSATEPPLARSKDGGATWTSSAAGIGASFIDTIVVDKKTPTTLYAGISFSTFFYKTTDGGNSWTQINLGTTTPSIITSIAVDPTNSSNVYAATSTNGIFVSTDGGVTWTNSSSGLPPGPIYTLAIDPNTPSTLYAGAFGFVFQSADAGSSWSPALASSGLTFRVVAIDPNSTVYAGGYYVLFKSLDGKSWKVSNGGVWAPGINSLAIDPNNPSTVYMGVQTPPDMFITKLDPAGNPVYSTYLGGTADEGAAAIAVDAAGNAYVSGYTCSANFPVVSDFFLTKTVGCDGAFAVQWDPTGFAAYSTLLGQGFGFHPYAIAIDAARSAYVAGWTGSTGAAGRRRGAAGLWHER